MFLFPRFDESNIPVQTLNNTTYTIVIPGSDIYKILPSQSLVLGLFQTNIFVYVSNVWIDLFCDWLNSQAGV